MNPCRNHNGFVSFCTSVETKCHQATTKEIDHFGHGSHFKSYFASSPTARMSLLAIHFVAQDLQNPCENWQSDFKSLMATSIGIHDDVDFNALQTQQITYICSAGCSRSSNKLINSWPQSTDWKRIGSSSILISLEYRSKRNLWRSANAITPLTSST